MKNARSASSILPLVCFFLLAGCESVHVPNFFGRDEVPDEVKAKPQDVGKNETPSEDTTWPRLGDVPFKPKEFSVAPDYDGTMDSMERDRAEAQAMRQDVVPEEGGDIAAQQYGGAATFDTQGEPRTEPDIEPPRLPAGLEPPQLPQK